MQLRQTIRDIAQEAAHDATQAMHEAAMERLHDAQQHVRDAQQRVDEAARNVRKAARAGADQQSEAQQELVDAQSELKDAQAELSRAQTDVDRTSHAMYTTQIPPDMQHLIPPQAVDISVAFFVTVAVIVVGRPIARAIGRRIERAGAPPALSQPAADSLKRIERTMDAMSLEIERISESQRYMVKRSAEPRGG